MRDMGPSNGVKSSVGEIGASDGDLAAIRALSAAAIAAEDAERFELSVERRALHADERRGARDIAAKARDLGQEIFALEHLARVAQRQGHELAALVPFDDGRSDRSDLGRQ